MRKTMLLIVLALSVVPAALAVDPPSSPAQLCQAQRTGMGPTAFNQLYGMNANNRNAFGKCVSKLAKAQEGGS